MQLAMQRTVFPSITCPVDLQLFCAFFCLRRVTSQPYLICSGSDCYRRPHFMTHCRSFAGSIDYANAPVILGQDQSQRRKCQSRGAPPTLLDALSHTTQRCCVLSGCLALRCRRVTNEMQITQSLLHFDAVKWSCVCLVHQTCPPLCYDANLLSERKPLQAKTALAETTLLGRPELL